MSKEGAITDTDLRECRSRALIALDRAKANDVDKIAVRIDNNIVIMIRRDQDPIEATRKFKEKLKHKK